MPNKCENHDAIVNTVNRWIDKFVVRYQLCPFAHAAVGRGQIRFVNTSVNKRKRLLAELESELLTLTQDDSIETTFLIHPNVLQDFYAYNEFMSEGNRLVQQLNLEGVVQIAGFHPHYEFAGAGYDAPENYANRSPYPMLHLLREDSITQALDVHPDINGVPKRNQDTLNRLGQKALARLWEACFDAADNRD